jgi:hypothetical protein
MDLKAAIKDNAHLIGTIIAAIALIGGIVWWAATIEAHVSRLDEQIAAVAKAIPASSNAGPSVGTASIQAAPAASQTCQNLLQQAASERVAGPSHWISADAIESLAARAGCIKNSN